MQKITKYFSRIDLQTLEKLAGNTIVRAVRSSYDTNRERALAQLVVDRYGVNLFRERSIRKAIVQALNANEIEKITDVWGLNHRDLFKSISAVEEKFGRAADRKLIGQFVSVLDLDPELVPPLVVETRRPVEIIEANYGETLISRGVLHDYQRHVKDKAVSEIESGTRKFLIQMPTGAGKTVTALELLVNFLRKPLADKIVIWLVDSSELAEQTLQAFKILWKLRGDRPITIARFFGRFDINFEEFSGVCFITFDKLYELVNTTRDIPRANLKNLCARASFVVVDEAHTSVAKTYEECIRLLTARDATLVGLTATPGRQSQDETAELVRLYGKKLLTIEPPERYGPISIINYLRLEKYLANIHYEELDSDVEIVDTDESKICRALAEDHNRNKKILDQIKRAVDSKDSTIVFACTKDHVFALVALCRASSISVDFIVGETPQAKRIEILSRFKNRDLLVLINHEILSTGIDVPNVNRLIVTRPVGSAILYSQIIGRALRGPKNGGNPSNTIINIRDNLLQFPTASIVFDSFANNFLLSRN